MEDVIKQVFRKFGIEITRYNPVQKTGFNPLSHINDFINLKTENANKGNMLLSFITEPFLLKPGEPLSTAHTNPGDSVQIAKAFIDLGYNVDVIHYRNETFIPKIEYSFFVGARTNFARIAKLLNKDCVKIVHLDTAHWVFNNYSSYRRTLELQQRRGVTIRESQRIIEQNLAIEYADYATIVGNDFTANTYQYAQKPIFQIPHTSCAVYPWPENKNYETCRKRYIWLGSSGFVHKGLDLVLDAFSEMPDYHLYVCGPMDKEPDFVKIYYKELYETPNIHSVGWVDVDGQKFMELINTCIGIIYPSCAECGAGNAITCMHAGLIPILSYESGTDVEDGFGLILKDCSVETIKRSIQTVSDFPAETLRQMSRKAWEFARANHTREKFAEEYKKIILNITSSYSEKGKLLNQNLIHREAFK